MILCYFVVPPLQEFLADEDETLIRIGLSSRNEYPPYPSCPNVASNLSKQHELLLIDVRLNGVHIEFFS